MKIKNLKWSASIAVLALLASCSDNEGTDDNGQDQDQDLQAAFYTAVLTDVSTNVIVDTYAELNSASAQLKVAVAALQETPTTANLESAREAWVNTRKPWEQSEGFLYGPVDTGGIDPAMDTWPVDVNAMNAILDSGDPITPAVLESNNEARGFHLLEYILWGIDGDKAIEDITTRELEYLVAAAADLHNNTQTLYDGWKADGDNYAANFVEAGESGSVYASRKGALEELVDGIITISDEVANGKIADPLNAEAGSPSPELEESRFSNNSKLDFANNIRSVQNVYLGTYASYNGKGLSDVVVEIDAQLDADIQAQITASIDAIEAIPGTFTDAISNNRDAVEEAQGQVNTLKNLLESKLLPLVSGL